MARKYILDTNLYIDAIRNPLKEQALERFLERNAPMTYMSAVVMLELRAGAVTDAQAKVLQDGIFGVFERRNRVVGPSAMAFKDCGRILATPFPPGRRATQRSATLSGQRCLDCDHLSRKWLYPADYRRGLQDDPTSSSRLRARSTMAGGR